MEPQPGCSSGTAGEGRRLLILRLANYTKKEDLMKVFRPHGAEHAVVLRKPTGNQAFLTFGNPEQAKKLVGQDFVIHKRKLRIRPADPWHEAKLIAPRPSADPFPGLDLTDKIPLPLDCIAKIASYLQFQDRAALELVSTRWREGTLASYSSIKRLDITDWRWPHGWHGKTVSMSALRWLLRRTAQHITVIMVNDESISRLLQPQILAILVKECPNLLHLDFTALTVRPSAIRNLVEVASKLESITLGKSQPPVEPELAQVFERAKGLKSLELSGTVLGGKAFRHLNPGLSHFKLDRCIGITAEYLIDTIKTLQNLISLELTLLQTLTDDTILTTLCNNRGLQQSLKILKIHALTFAEAQLHPNEMDIQLHMEEGEFVEIDLGPVNPALPIFRVMREIVHLSLTFCGWVTVDTVRVISANLSRITHLNLSGCTNIRGEAALDSLINLEELEVLEINNLYPEVPGYTLGSLKGLKEVHCRSNPLISGEDICRVIRNCPYIGIIDVEGYWSNRTLHDHGHSAAALSQTAQRPRYVLKGRLIGSVE
ncbi:putative RNA-binding protein EEED8.10 [Halictus rubicundus]|uniref:putative RNA-binding protein EEED8.10 n=1 Tax=Halictus rubicundus TaxID=77578 RepID=UPI00403623E5